MAAENIRYSSFGALVDSWENSDRPALLFVRGDKMESWSFRTLAAEIRRRAEAFSAESWHTALIVAGHTPETVRDIFACILSGRSAALGEESLSIEQLGLLANAVGADRILGSESRYKVHAAAHPAVYEGGRLLFFTSGTTSACKGAVLTDAAFCASAWNGQEMLACGPEDKVLSLLPLAHVFGFVCTLLWPLCYGASVALGRGMRHYGDDCDFFRPTILPVVPSLLNLLLRIDVLNPELRCILVGAAPLPAESVRTLRQRGMEVRFGYGLTETASGIALSMAGREPLAMYPCPDSDIRIEPDGEISVATPCLMEGYTGAAADTVPGGRFYTGDLGRMEPDGALYITGRKKDVLVLGDGTKIFCAEFEAALAHLMGTEELAITLRDDRPVLMIGRFPEDERVRQAVQTFNCSQARSRQITRILRLAEPLPRTVTGKIQHWKLNTLPAIDITL